MIESLILGFHLESRHLNADPDWHRNNHNLGIYALVHDTEVGVYHNSIRRYSWYVSQTVLGEPAKGLSLNLGLVTGYRAKLMGIKTTPIQLTNDQGSGVCIEQQWTGYRHALRGFATANYTFPQVVGVSPRLTLTRNLIHVSIQKEFK